jgi:transposase-like protein
MSSSRRSRRHFTTEQKVAILERHMVDKVPVSDLCNELGLQPSVFYQWQRQALENLAGTFSTPAADGPSKREKELVAKTKELEAKLAKKDNVIAAQAAQFLTRRGGPLGEPMSTPGVSARNAQDRATRSLPSGRRQRGVSKWIERRLRPPEQRSKNQSAAPRRHSHHLDGRRSAFPEPARKARRPAASSSPESSSPCAAALARRICRRCQRRVPPSGRGTGEGCRPDRLRW